MASSRGTVPITEMDGHLFLPSGAPQTESPPTNPRFGNQQKHYSTSVILYESADYVTTRICGSLMSKLLCIFAALS